MLDTSKTWSFQTGVIYSGKLSESTKEDEGLGRRSRMPGRELGAESSSSWVMGVIHWSVS